MKNVYLIEDSIVVLVCSIVDHLLMAKQKYSNIASGVSWKFYSTIISWKFTRCTYIPVYTHCIYRKPPN